jgi:hypothetical protein
MPEAVRGAVPQITERDWDAFLRLTTFINIAMSRP